MIDRVLLLILDSLGIGELPDANEYGDEGSNTLAHISYAVDLGLPNLEKMGLGLLGDFRGIRRASKPSASYGVMSERSKGKDTTTGHWEMMGIILEEPFPTYPKGFPKDIVDSFRKAIGMDILGNIPASGTEIIKELGEEHLKTEKPIIYTSADSVFQIAAHEEVIPLEDLYEICKIARKILVYPHNVSRVIARPFVGRPGSFTRTSNRRDFSVEPPKITLLDKIKEAGLEVVGIGKIEDLFAGRGITKAIHIKDNMDGVDQMISEMNKTGEGLIFTNLVDFDTLYGHRNDPAGYAEALAEFDKRLPEIIAAMREEDLLIITADHGNDPTTPSTDHSREYVPLLVYGKGINAGVDLGARKTFADIGQTIAEIFKMERLEAGESFWSYIDMLK
ncbi:MAG: phosphopentomutase [Nitrospirae bacterium]|nr:phosphopentomutase [Nitrospirota bacterium]